MYTQLTPGMLVLSPNGKAHIVDHELARDFAPGDRLVGTHDDLLRIPKAELQVADSSISRSLAAFNKMSRLPREKITAFYLNCAALLAEEEIWQEIAWVNERDVEAARSQGRSTTRLAVSQSMRNNMIRGLEVWAQSPSLRDQVIRSISHENFKIEEFGAGLGVVAFVFEGRPNVLIDACGVLSSGNTTVFRIGRDAVATATAIMELCIQPALLNSGLPEDAVCMLASTSHSSGWALFLDQRISLAVARGSGHAVGLLGSLAKSVGTPVSLHGTGGAWLVASDSADSDTFARAVVESLDRKVCNTLNTCCITLAAAERLVPVFLRSLNIAGDRCNAQAKLHITKSSKAYVGGDFVNSKIQVEREGTLVEENQAELVEIESLSTEWEWESNPELTLVVVRDLEEAIDLFNQYSPRLVASLISEDEVEQNRFWNDVDAPFVGDGFTRWVDGQYALAKPELGLSNWEYGRLFGRSAILTGEDVFTVRTRYKSG